MADEDFPIIKPVIKGVEVDELPETVLRERLITFMYVATTFGPITGVFRVGGVDVATFTNQAPDGLIVADWLDTKYTLASKPDYIRMPANENAIITLEITAPVEHTYQWDFNRHVPTSYTGDLQAFFTDLYRGEWDGDLSLANLLARIRDTLTDPAPTIGISFIDSLYSISDAIHETNQPAPRTLVAVGQADEIGNLYVIPTPQEILGGYEHYIYGASSLAGASSVFVVADNRLTNTANSASHNVLLSPINSDTIYQSMRISSTNQDDDSMGWVVGYKEVGELKYFLLVIINLSSTQPTAKLVEVRIPLATVPNTGTVAIWVGGNIVLNQMFFSETQYQASNKGSLAGWLQSPWVDGISVNSSFDGTQLEVTFGVPGNTTGLVYNKWTFTQADIPEIAGYTPRAGLYNYSQIGGIWNNFTVIDIGGSVANLETGTIWGPDNNTPPNYVDTGVTIDMILGPNEYSYSEKTGVWLYRDPLTGNIRRVIGRPIP